jgi:hypothetical protein
MSIGRIIGIAALVLGVVLLVMGLNQSDSAAEEIRQEVTGEYSDQTQWQIYGGIAALVAGVALLIFGGRLGPLARKPG